MSNAKKFAKLRLSQAKPGANKTNVISRQFRWRICQAHNTTFCRRLQSIFRVHIPRTSIKGTFSKITGKPRPIYSNLDSTFVFFIFSLIYDIKSCFNKQGDLFINRHNYPQFYYIRFLESHIQQLEKRIQEQDSKIHELEAHLSKNSSNSSKPPVSDGLNKPPKTTSQRSVSGKKPGGKMVELEKRANKLHLQIMLSFTLLILLEYHLSLPPLPQGRKGKQKPRPGKNLLDRLSE